MGLLDLFYIAKEKLLSIYDQVKNFLSGIVKKSLSFMVKCVNVVTEKLRKAVIGSTHFFRKLGNKYQQGTKNYYVDEELGEWTEATVTQQVSLEDIPPEYRAKWNEIDEEFEYDDTRELDAALALEY